jgi:hypothetical protein
MQASFHSAVIANQVLCLRCVNLQLLIEMEIYIQYSKMQTTLSSLETVLSK